MTPALEVEALTVGYQTGPERVLVVVRDVWFALEPGRLLGVAGETGSGKSTAVLSAIGFPISGSVRLGGASRFGELDLLQQPVGALRRLWGRDIAYVAQDASQSLSPLMRIERLLGEPLRLHLGMGGAVGRGRSIELLQSVGLPDPEQALRRYPHQFSGGQQQRIALAIAMACNPKVLVLDEPTTGLDVTTQAQISRLIAQLVRESGTAAVMISHDLALLATSCDDISIMYAGEIVEHAAADEIYDAPRHPYTAALIDAVPRVDDPVPVVGIPGLPATRVIDDACAFAARCRFSAAGCIEGAPALASVSPDHLARCIRAAELGVIPSSRSGTASRHATRGETPILRVDGLTCSYRSGHGKHAVDDVSLSIVRGETLGLVGESGSGKSTILRAIAGLHVPDAGTIDFDGQRLAARTTRRPRSQRRALQLVFQDPHASLNPRHTVRATLDRPLALFHPEMDAGARRERVHALLADVRLDPIVLERYPNQLSGGQKQRVALARAFAADPEVILCDEVVSALDVSVQASILELLARLSADYGTALLFVTHDLAVVRTIANRVCVMRDGRILEAGPTEEIFSRPTDDYTRALLAAVPRPAVSAAR